MPRSAENEKQQLGAMSVLLILLGLSVVLGGCAFSILQMRRQSEQWIELSSKSKAFVDAFADRMREGAFDEARAYLSANLSATLDDEKLAKLRTEIESMGPSPGVMGWTLHGGSSGIRLSTSGLRVSSEPPVLDFRLGLPTPANEPPADLGFLLTYERNRMVLDRIERRPRLQAPAPPVVPAPPAAIGR